MKREAALALTLAGVLAAPAFAHDPGSHHGHRTSSHHRSGHVRQAQEKLQQMGYDVGKVDGVAGPQTRAAVEKFQHDQGLKATGRLDTQTLAALNLGKGGGSTTSGRPMEEPGSKGTQGSPGGMHGGSEGGPQSDTH